MMEFLNNPLVQFLITASLSLIGVIVAIIAALLPYLKRNSQNKGITDEQKQIASASRTRSFFSVLAVLLFFMAAVVGILHLVGIVVGGWPNPLVIVMITAGVVFIILQWAFPLGRSPEDVAYDSWLNRFNKQLASSDTGTIVIHGDKKMQGHKVWIWEDRSDTSTDTSNSTTFVMYTIGFVPIYVAVFGELVPNTYFIRMTLFRHKKKWVQSTDTFLEEPGDARIIFEERVAVQPQQKLASEVDWRKKKPIYIPSLLEK